MRRLSFFETVLIVVFLLGVSCCAPKNIEPQPPAEIVKQAEPPPLPPPPAPAEKVVETTVRPQEPPVETPPQQQTDTDEPEEDIAFEQPAQEVPQPPEPPKKSDQEILDSAMEFLQASYEHWERNEFDNAVAALDEAYALILAVDGSQNADIQQQKEDLRITISRRIVECYSSRFTSANGRYDAIPLTKNSYVEKALSLFTDKERSFFLEAYRRSGRYRAAIVDALTEAGLPKELAWLPLIESGFKVRALSRARALGLWQFIASTGYKFGLKRDPWIDERMDPEKSTRAAIGYLKELHQIFGDWTTVLAAYNCGEWTVLKAIRSQRINYLDNFWDLYEQLPSETAFYVPRFLAVLHILNDPEGYGMQLPEPDPAPLSEYVTIQKPVHLSEIAKRIDVSYEELQDLNPELRIDATPPTLYALRIPQGKAPILTAQIDSLPLYHAPSSAYVVHKVAVGDSFASIARKYKTSVQAILRANGLSRNQGLKVGWKLKIPTGRVEIASAEQKGDGPVKVKDTAPLKYTVKKGDTLSAIAKRHGTTVKVIQNTNSLQGDRVKIGQVILIPPGAPAPSVGVKTKPYKVTDGDTPFMIAQKHNMTLSEFLKLNDLTPKSKILKGQTVLVRAQ